MVKFTTGSVKKTFLFILLCLTGYQARASFLGLGDSSVKLVQGICAAALSLPAGMIGVQSLKLAGKTMISLAGAVHQSKKRQCMLGVSLLYLSKTAYDNKKSLVAAAQSAGASAQNELNSTIVMARDGFNWMSERAYRLVTIPGAIWEHVTKPNKKK